MANISKLRKVSVSNFAAAVSSFSCNGMGLEALGFTWGVINLVTKYQI